MSESRNFCGVGDFPMLIPYAEVVKLVEAAKKTEALERKLDRLEKQQEALRTMYFELVEKYGELSRMI